MMTEWAMAHGWGSRRHSLAKYKRIATERGGWLCGSRTIGPTLDPREGWNRYANGRALTERCSKTSRGAMSSVRLKEPIELDWHRGPRAIPLGFRPRARPRESSAPGR